MSPIVDIVSTFEDIARLPSLLDSTRQVGIRFALTYLTAIPAFQESKEVKPLRINESKDQKTMDHNLKAAIPDPRMECIAAMLNTESPDVMHHLARALVFIATTRRPVRYADQEAR